MIYKRCGFLEVAPVAEIHVALSSIHRVSTTLMSSNENINNENFNRSNGKQSCNGMTGRKYMEKEHI